MHAHTGKVAKPKKESRPPTRDRDSGHTGAHTPNMLRETSSRPHSRQSVSLGEGEREDQEGGVTGKKELRGQGWIYASAERRLFINGAPVSSVESAHLVERVLVPV